MPPPHEGVELLFVTQFRPGSGHLSNRDGHGGVVGPFTWLPAEAPASHHRDLELGAAGRAELIRSTQGITGGSAQQSADSPVKSKLSNLEVVQGFSAGSLTAWIVRAPAEVGRLVDTPAGGEAAWPAPRPGLGGVVGEIPIQGRPADAEELGDIPCGVPIGFHTSCGRDVAGV